MAARPLPDDLIELIACRFRVLADPTQGVFALCDHVRGDLADRHESLYEVVARAERRAGRRTRLEGSGEPSPFPGRECQGGGGSETS